MCDPGGPDEHEVLSVSPFVQNQTIVPLDSGLPPFGLGVPSSDGLHTTYFMECPGGDQTLVSLPDTFLLNPTNTGTCPCAIYPARFTSAGIIVGSIVQIRRGMSMPTYQVEDGASTIVVGCAGNCLAQDCKVSLTIAVGIA